MFARILPGTLARCCATFDDTRKLESQISWLKRSLRQSNALWKVIAVDMPLSVVVPEGTDSQGRPAVRNSANGDGPAPGRELEIADLLSYIGRSRIRNTVWITADVHYAAAIYPHPNRAQFTDFHPFWEFIAGPLNAGMFGPNLAEAVHYGRYTNALRTDPALCVRRCDAREPFDRVSPVKTWNNQARQIS